MSASFISLLFTETKKIKFFTKENGFVAFCLRLTYIERDWLRSVTKRALPISSPIGPRHFWTWYRRARFFISIGFDPLEMIGGCRALISIPFRSRSRCISATVPLALCRPNLS